MVVQRVGSCLGGFGGVFGLFRRVYSQVWESRFHQRVVSLSGNGFSSRVTILANNPINVTEKIICKHIDCGIRNISR